VDRALVPVLGQDGRGRRGVVGAGGGADPTGAGRTDDAVLQVGGQLVGVVLGVPAVAQDHVRHPGLGQGLLGAAVLGSQQEC
jgi:hypothetical protein